MKEKIINYVFNKYIKNIKINDKFKTGDTITIHYNIKELEKNRIQLFKGIVIQKKYNKKGITTFTVRKISDNIGVERIFMLNSPFLKKIEINKKGKVKRSKIFYFRKLKGKKAKIKEIK
ncbi:50S ribosomal protein L19 [Candidatus Shikimatogenerans silvanidophilus]|uniref:50S ribosomal protein L19 n=1 Tax=Candidatus Shikimatogenerans silvanidophilus TaxID=2782547 RepID=UPI001BAB5B4A|nr:50S ribosomal protein L19 [Candidatus Shikimatogenerans silvanidophilus]